MPVFDNFCVQASVKRVGVGGKAVTNLLKEMLTFRHLPLMEEWYVVNELKETAWKASVATQAAFTIFYLFSIDFLVTLMEV